MTTIVLPVAELKPALTGLSKVIPRRPVRDILNHLQVHRLSTGEIRLTATDLNHTLTYTMIHHDVTEEASLLVRFEDLANVVKSCASLDLLTLEAEEGHSTVIRFPIGGQSGAHQCKPTPAVEFPHVASMEGEPYSMSETLRAAVLEALECASTDSTRPILNGAFIDVRDQHAHYVVGTDGHHLFSSNSFKLPLKDSVFVPGHKLLHWKGFLQDGTWQLRSDNSGENEAPRFEISSEHWRFQAQGIQGKYPDWKMVVPSATAFQTSVSIDGDALPKLIMTAQRVPVYEDRHHTVGIKVADDNCWLLGRCDANQPWSGFDVPTSGVSGPPVTIFCNKLMLLKALRLGLTRIEIIDPSSPLRFSHAGRQMIIMPLRIVGNAPAAIHHAPESGDASPNITPSSPPSEDPPPNLPTPPMHQHDNPSATAAATQSTTGDQESKSSLEAALVQLETVKTGFRQAINGLTKLGDQIRQAMREQKASDKEVHSVRQTLRSLQSVRL